MWYDKMLENGRQAFLKELNHDHIKDIEIQTVLGNIDDLVVGPVGINGLKSATHGVPKEALIMFTTAHGEWDGILFHVKERVRSEGWNRERPFIRYYEIENILFVTKEGIAGQMWFEGAKRKYTPQAIPEKFRVQGSLFSNEMSEGSHIWYEWPNMGYYPPWLDIGSYLWRLFFRWQNDPSWNSQVAVTEEFPVNILVIPRQAWPGSAYDHDAINRKVI